MAYKRREVKNPFLEDTKIENLFIHEYMAEIPGDYVKVFLVISMWANSDGTMNDNDIAVLLRMKIEDVKKGIDFLIARGLLKKVEEDLIVENLKELFYGEKSAEEESVAKEILPVELIEDHKIKDMYIQIEKIIGRPLTGIELSEILTWINQFHATDEVVVSAYMQAMTKNKDNHRYVGKIVKEWTGKGIKTVLDVDEYLTIHDQRKYTYKRIMQALGFHRTPTEEEKRLVDVWMNEIGATLDEILEACKRTSGIGNPNFNYVDKVIKGMKKDQKEGKTKDKNAPTAAVVVKYYEEIRKEAEAKAKSRRDEVSRTIPEISQIDDKIGVLRMDVAKIMFGDSADKKELLEQNKAKQNQLLKEKNTLLTRRGIPIDYDTINYRCQICEDTGTTEDGVRCRCYKERTEEASKWQKQ